MNEKDSLLKTKKRYFIIHCTWDAWERLENKKTVYMVKDTVESLGGLKNVVVTVYDDESEEYFEVQ